MLDFLSNMGGGMLGGITQGIGGAIGGGIASSIGDKWFGAPQPSDAINHQKKLMDALYPGTTPFERLSAGGGGAAQAGAVTAQGDAQRKHEKEIASIGAMTEIAKTNINADVTTRGQDLTSGLIDNPATAAFIRNLSTQDRKNEEQALLAIQQAAEAAERAKKLGSETYAQDLKNKLHEIEARYPGTVFAKLYSTGNPAQWGNMTLLLNMIRKGNEREGSDGVTVPQNQREFETEEFFKTNVGGFYR